MVTTRSRNQKAQAKIEDFDDGKKQLGGSKSKASKSTAPTKAKRKAPTSNEEPKYNAKPAKKQKAESKDAAGEATILINRAPVVHLPQRGFCNIYDHGDSERAFDRHN